MATLLVTGGAGFIGSALIRHVMRETDYAVINVDKLTYAGNLESLGDVTEGPRYRFAQTDVCDRAAIGQLLREHSPDAVLHLAAESHVDRSISAPAEFIQTNIVGTYLLLEAVRDYWEKLPPGKRDRFRLQHVSTDEVYGDLGATGRPFTETTPYAPSSPYSASKASADHLVRAWCRTYGLPVLITNCSNNYGPYQFPEKLIPLVITNALEGRSLPVYGDGEQVRDWLYVDDHARALIAVCERGVVGETYNIGGHNEQRNIDVVRQTCALLDELAPRHGHAALPSGRRYEDLVAYVRDRPGHDSRYAIDAGKMQRDLNWVPLETFGTGLRKTVEWYLTNAEWVARVRSGEYRNWLDAHYGARG